MTALAMAGEFNGKVIVISGGSRGIGRGIGVAFAREGAQTVLASSSEHNLAEAAKAVAARIGTMTIIRRLYRLALSQTIELLVRPRQP